VQRRIAVAFAVAGTVVTVVVLATALSPDAFVRLMDARAAASPSGWPPGWPPDSWRGHCAAGWSGRRPS
jgi:hypothetical protein